MNAFARSFVLAASIALLFVLPACATDPESGTDSANSNAAAQSTNPCAGKACGSDCTPTGSDEPFNCNAASQCVVTGQSLGCNDAGVGDAGFDGDAAVPDAALDGGPACPEFLADCLPDEIPADLDGDGCIDGCRPLHCSGN